MSHPQSQWVSQAPQYEFGRHENAVFGDVARWMRVVAVLSVLGLFTPLHFEGALGKMLTLVVSALLWLGARGFRRVVCTEGHDVTHLMEALDRLTTVLTLRSVARLVGFALAAVAATALLLALLVLEQLPPDML